ncbi:MAG: hypothetical protein HKN67_02820 [Saprospiraceae bacterium]|nr:hypothetical protein [Saprospiraceae bacterium]
MSNNYLDQFNIIAERFSFERHGVVKGKMMSSPGLKYNNKIFAFYHKETMGFRLGPDFKPGSFGLMNAKPLSPFKTKPPLKGWYVVDHNESNLWEDLTELALEFTMTLK